MTAKRLLNSGRKMASSQPVKSDILRRYATGTDKLSDSYSQSSEKGCAEDYVQSVIQRYLHDAKTHKH